MIGGHEVYVPPAFQKFESIPRLFRECVITEKIDGTNACVVIGTYLGGKRVVQAQSRKRIITPEDDNFGFAKWVQDHADELYEGLGDGYHYGEWWGQGIQRGYGLDHKRFSLFNVNRWHVEGDKFEGRPACCDVVPIIHRGLFDTSTVDEALNFLRAKGSLAAPWPNAEGVVVYHVKGRCLFKATLDGDGHKGVE